MCVCVLCVECVCMCVLCCSVYMCICMCEGVVCVHVLVCLCLYVGVSLCAHECTYLANLVCLTSTSPHTCTHITHTHMHVHTHSQAHTSLIGLLSTMLMLKLKSALEFGHLFLWLQITFVSNTFAARLMTNDHHCCFLHFSPQGDKLVS